jgi:predicted ATPase/DNA-binding SARP family transcriptional activator
MGATGTWQLRLLGEFRLTHGEAPVHLPTRKAASLLAFLVLHPGRHSREHLATLFWGDFPDVEARRSLRTALSALRTTLGDEAFIASREAVQLNPAFPLWVDAVAFQHEAGDFCVAPDAEPAASFLDLYGGELLAGFDHEWIIPEREQLRALYVTVLLRVAQTVRSESDYRRAARFAERVLQVEPSNERAYQHLIFCCTMLGDRSTALRHYEACCRALADDLGVEPTEATTQLHRWAQQSSYAQPHEARSTNLPVPASSFIGRRRELTDCTAMLHLPDVRLLTLTGSGGSGKTRLAIQAAWALVAEYAHGVFFVDLSALRQVAMLPAAIARTLGVQPLAEQTTTDAILDFLRDKHLLLLLDNFEQIIEGAPQLAQLLQVAPRLKLLVTSRAPLHLSSEQEYPVLPLPVPDAGCLPDMQRLSQYDAVALFVDRALAVQPGFRVTNASAPAVASVCARLDGLPLAIELAAARIRLLPPEAILAQLEHSLDFLVAGARDLPARHQTLRAAIDWSYTLLTPEQQQMFRRLAVFAGGWTMRSAQAVCGGAVLEGLAALAENGLVSRSDVGVDKPRFTMLETIRCYALERLAESGEEVAVHESHLSTFLSLAEDAALKLHGPDARLYLDCLETEHENMRVALQSAIDTGDAEHGLSLGVALWGLWQIRNHLRDALRWYGVLLALPTAEAAPLLRAQALTYMADAAREAGLPQGEVLSTQALDLCRCLGDKRALAQALFTRSHFEPRESRRAMLKESIALYRELGDGRCVADMLGWLSEIVMLDDIEVEGAITMREEAIELARAAGDKALLADLLISHARDTAQRANIAGARRLVEEARDLAQEIGNRDLLATALTWQSRMVPSMAERIRLQQQALDITLEMGYRNRAAVFHSWLGEEYCAAGDLDAAESCFRRGLALSREIGNQFAEALACVDFGRLANLRGDYAAVLAPGLAALRLMTKGQTHTWLYWWCLRELGHRAVAVGEWPRAARIWGAIAAFNARTGYDRHQIPFIEENLATVHKRMADPAVAAAWAEGKAMTIEQAGLRELRHLEEMLGEEERQWAPPAHGGYAC